MEKIKIAIIGYGGIARKHNEAYAALISENVPIELVAVCDKDKSRITQTLNFNLSVGDTPLPKGIHIYDDIDEMLEKEDFDLADICLPTFLHHMAAVKCLEAGRHVICEKPMALSSHDCEEMIAKSREVNKRLMIAHILRFNERFRLLDSFITDGRYGKLLELSLNRFSVYPGWGVGSYFNDISKCGGATLDTHIHDIDIAQKLLGIPESVSAVEHYNIPHVQSVSTRMYYKDTTVIASCAWDATFKESFRSDYRARFERATVYSDSEEVTVYPYDGEAFTVSFDTADGYKDELHYMIKMVIDEKIENTVCAPAESCVSVKLIEAIRESASRRGETVKIKL